MLKNKIKYLIYLLLGFMFIIPNVFAEGKIGIKEVVLNTKTETTKIESEAVSTNSAVKFDIDFKKVNDYAEYKITINNPTSNDYKINENASKSKYITYEYRYDDDNKIAEGNKDTIVYFKIKYSNEAPDEVFLGGNLIETEDLDINFVFSSLDTDGYGNVDEQVENPLTNDNVVIWMITLTVSFLAAIILFKKTKNNKYLCLILIGILLLPVSTFALEKIQINMESKITIEKRKPVTETIYWALQDNDSNDTNETLVFADHELTGNYMGHFSGNEKFESSNDVPWTQIGYNYISNGLSRNVTTVRVDGIIAPKYTKLWLNGVGYSASTLDIDLTNLDVNNVETMEKMFYQTGYEANEIDIKGLDTWDASNTTNMSHMFDSCGIYSNKFNIDLSDWYISNVTDMSNMFWNAGGGSKVWSIGDINNWDVSNVKDMSYMLYSAGRSVENTFSLNLSNWNTSNVENMEYLFYYTGNAAQNWAIEGLNNWNTSNVKNMRAMFYSAAFSATNFSLDLSNWDTSNVTNMNTMFYKTGYNATNWKLEGLNKWNVSNVTNTGEMFNQAGKKATDFNLDLSNWNTSSLDDASFMFYETGRFSTNFNIDISNWNSSNLSNINNLFMLSGENSPTWQIIIPKTNGNGISNTTERMYGKNDSTFVKSSVAGEGKLFTIAS